MDLPQQTNKMTGIGLLKSKDISFETMTFKNSPQPQEVVKGNLVIEFVDKEKVNNIRIDVFSTRYSKKGTELASYKSAKRLIAMKTIDDEGRDNASRIMINGNVSLNSYHDKEGQFHKNYRLNGSFFKNIDKDNDKYKDGVTARMVMTILGYRDELKEEEPTGNQFVKAVNIGFGNHVNQIPNLKFNMPILKDYIDDIVDLYPIGSTGYYEMIFNNYVQKEKTESQQHGFGIKLPETVSHYVRSQEIVFVGAEPYDDENKEYLNSNQVKAATKQLNDLESKSVKQSSQSSNANTKGFGQNHFNNKDIDVSSDDLPF